MNTEITNEVVENAAEEIVVNESSSMLKKFGIVGGVLVVGGLAYKYVVKPMVAKKKAAKDEITSDIPVAEYTEEEVSEEE